MSYTSEQIAEMFPNIARLRPETAAQLTTDNGAWDAPAHPEVWLHNRFDYFKSVGGVKPDDHTHTTPYVGGWESLSDGRYASGGVGAYSPDPRRAS